jgi:adenine phosphoribosyltransferase
VVIVDDTLSTGGTIIALAECIKVRGACLVDVVAVVEKMGGEGMERVRVATALTIQTLLQVKVSRDGVNVLSSDEDVVL